MTDAEARARLETMVAASSQPTLSTAEVDRLMALARRPDRYRTDTDTYQPWQVSRAYAVGDLVVPTVRNSHYYKVTASDGAAGTTEPTWPTTSGAAVTADGVTYTEQGSAPWIATWDLNAAAAEGWRQKAGKIAGEFDFSIGAGSYSRSQAYAMCLDQAKTYAKKVIGSASMGSFPFDEFEYVVGNRAE